MANKSAHIKKNLIEALVQSMGVVQQACTKVGISRTTYYEYYRTDSKFKEAVDDCKNIALDFAESKLMKNIDSGKEASIMFYLKTQGKARGYIERQELETKQIIEPADLSHLSIKERKQLYALMNKAQPKDDTEDAEIVE